MDNKTFITLDGKRVSIGDTITISTTYKNSYSSYRKEITTPLTESLVSILLKNGYISIENNDINTKKYSFDIYYIIRKISFSMKHSVKDTEKFLMQLSDLNPYLTTKLLFKFISKELEKYNNTEKQDIYYYVSLLDNKVKEIKSDYKHFNNFVKVNSIFRTEEDANFAISLINEYQSLYGK